MRRSLIRRVVTRVHEGFRGALDGVFAEVPEALSGQRFVRGRCNVCGRRTRFFYPAPELFRESLTCEHCRTTSRYRSIARGLLVAVERQAGIRAASVAGLAALRPNRRLRVHDTQPPFRFEVCAYPLPEMLRRCSWIDLSVSTFKPGSQAGAVVAPGVVNENLERLTLGDASVDVLITSDVMEHVRLDGRAHAEIARVVRPGGCYLFTVPHFRDRHDTLVRVEVTDPDDPDRDRFLTEPEYHGDANSEDGRGALSYRSYGTELDEQLAGLGLSVEYTKADWPAAGILNTELFYCTRVGAA
ncbi:MAG: class I SAM-dependent methyltransferase [Acidobacteriota bacterium]